MSDSPLLAMVKARIADKLMTDGKWDAWPIDKDMALHRADEIISRMNNAELIDAIGHAIAELTMPGVTEDI